MQTYCTASKFLGGALGRAERAAELSNYSLDQMLSLVAAIFRDLDRPGGGVGAERQWVEATALVQRDALLDAIDNGRRVFAPQLLLEAVVEIMEVCAPGPVTEDRRGLNVLLRTVLAIADETKVAETRGGVWGGVAVELAAELVANSYSNHAPNIVDLMSSANSDWMRGWEEGVAVKASQLGPSPAELYAAATSVPIDAVFRYGYYLWLRATERNEIRFSSVTLEAVVPRVLRLELEALFVQTVHGLKAQLEVSRRGSPASRWDHDTFRRRPLVRLTDGSILVLRLNFLLQRAFGVLLDWDVRDFLHDSAAPAGAGMSGSENTFMQAMSSAFEGYVGNTLRRTFPAAGLQPTVYSESTMREVWRTRKHAPKVADWAVRGKQSWMVFEVFDHTVPRSVLSGNTSKEDLDGELFKLIHERKGAQLASTAALLAGGAALPGGGGGDSERAVRKYLVLPNDGLTWSPVVLSRLEELAIQYPDTATDVQMLTMREIMMLESAMEQGYSPEGLLADWSVDQRSIPFDRYLELSGVALRPSKWQFQQTDDLLAALGFPTLSSSG